MREHTRYHNSKRLEYRRFSKAYINPFSEQPTQSVWRGKGEGERLGG